jgi:hypothetical protein
VDPFCTLPVAMHLTCKHCSFCVGITTRTLCTGDMHVLPPTCRTAPLAIVRTNTDRHPTDPHLTLSASQNMGLHLPPALTLLSALSVRCVLTAATVFRLNIFAVSPVARRALPPRVVLRDLLRLPLLQLALTLCPLQGPASPHHCRQANLHFAPCLADTLPLPAGNPCKSPGSSTWSSSVIRCGTITTPQLHHHAAPHTNTHPGPKTRTQTFTHFGPIRRDNHLITPGTAHNHSQHDSHPIPHCTKSIEKTSWGQNLCQVNNLS